MSDKSRPSTRSDGSSAVTETTDRETREDQSFPIGAKVSTEVYRSNPTASAAAGGGEPSRLRLGSSCSSSCSNNSLLGFQSRSPLFRRLSSGYFSFEAESLPNSPLHHPAVVQVEDKSTQTPSLCSQLVTHAVHRIAEAHSGEQWRGSRFCLPSSGATMARHTRAEIEIGLELRRLGDQFNDVLMHRGDRPPPRQEPPLLLCMGILLLLITRLLYSQGITMDNNPDQSQV